MRKRLMAGTACIALVTVAVAARAQTVPAAPGGGTTAALPSGQAAAPAPRNTHGLEEVVITAQRRREDVQKAGIAVSAISGRSLVAAGVTNPQQLGNVAPAISVENAGGANTLYFLRGVGNFTVNGYTDPAIAFNYDGVYVNTSSETLDTFFDLARVEILKGPQGTLYGRNATGGAINVIPEQPVLGAGYSGYVTATYGNYHAYSVDGAVNIPLSPDTAIRLSGSTINHSGYLDDNTSDQQSYAGRAQILSKINNDLSVRLAIDSSYDGGNGEGTYYANSFQYDPETGKYVITPSGLPSSSDLLDHQNQAFRESVYDGLAGRNNGALPNQQYLNNAYWGANAEIIDHTGYGTLTLIPAYRGAKEDFAFDGPAFDGINRIHDNQYSFEARWAGNRIGIFDYLIGGYYYDSSVVGHEAYDQDVLNFYSNYSTYTESYAGFARVTAHITDKFRVIGGVRVTNDQKSYNGYAFSVTEVCTVVVNGRPSCPNAPVLPTVLSPYQLGFPVLPYPGALPIIEDGEFTGAIAATGINLNDHQLGITKVTQRAGLEYDITPTSLAYASYESGYRSGGFSEAVGFETFQPEYIDAYTVGVKNRFFDNQVQFNVEGFLWKYRNQQISHLADDSAGVLADFTQNVGRSTNQGVEVDGRWLVTPTTELTVDAQYLATDYSSFKYPAPDTSSAPFVGCPTEPDPSNAGEVIVNCSGKPSYEAPKWTINFGGQQTIPLPNYDIVVEADTQYKSSRYIGFEYLPFELVHDTFDTNARITLQPNAAKWSLTAYIQHIEGGRIPFASQVDDTNGLSTLEVGPPRLFGLRLTARF